MLLGASSAEQLMENIGAIQASWEGRLLGVSPPRPWGRTQGHSQSLVQPVFVGHLRGPVLR